jgi:hypothetical protein
MSSAIKRGTIVKITLSFLEGPRKAKVSSKKKNGWLRCTWLSPESVRGVVFSLRNTFNVVDIWKSEPADDNDNNNSVLTSKQKQTVPKVIPNNQLGRGDNVWYSQQGYSNGRGCCRATVYYAPNDTSCNIIHIMDTISREIIQIPNTLDNIIPRLDIASLTRRLRYTIVNPLVA